MTTDKAKTDEIIDVEDHIDALEKLLKRHGLAPETLELVEDLYDEKNPFRVAASYKIEKRILMKRAITREEQRGVMEALKDFDARSALLEDDLTFLKHTLCHEICHILWRYKNCDECDAWAFYEMKF